MYVCMYMCIHACMYAMHAYMHVYKYVLLYVCMYVCMYVCIVVKKWTADFIMVKCYIFSNLVVRLNCPLSECIRYMKERTHLTKRTLRGVAPYCPIRAYLTGSSCSYPITTVSLGWTADYLLWYKVTILQSSGQADLSSKCM